MNFCYVNIVLVEDFIKLYVTSNAVWSLYSYSKKKINLMIILFLVLVKRGSVVQYCYVGHEIHISLSQVLKFWQYGDDLDAHTLF